MRLVPLIALLLYFSPRFSPRVSVAFGYDKGWLKQINAGSHYGNRPENTRVTYAISQSDLVLKRRRIQ
jgi:hypothetical protein